MSGSTAKLICLSFLSRAFLFVLIEDLEPEILKGLATLNDSFSHRNVRIYEMGIFIQKSSPEPV